MIERATGLSEPGGTASHVVEPLSSLQRWASESKISLGDKQRKFHALKLGSKLPESNNAPFREY